MDLGSHPAAAAAVLDWFHTMDLVLLVVDCCNLLLVGASAVVGSVGVVVGGGGVPGVVGTGNLTDDHFRQSFDHPFDIAAADYHYSTPAVDSHHHHQYLVVGSNHLVVADYCC